MKKVLVLLVLFFGISNSAFAVDIDVDLHGYYRIRLDYFVPLKYDIYTFDETVNRFSGEVTRSGSPAYIEQRMRLDPIFRVHERIALHTQFDILNNVLFGENGGTELNFLDFLSPTSDHQKNVFSSENPALASIEVSRVFGEVKLSIGELFFGRMPLSWGMGLLFHPGDGLDDNDGSSADQIFYLTRPSSLWGNHTYPLYFGAAYGKHQEDDIFVGSDDITELDFQVFYTNEDLHALSEQPFWQRKLLGNWIGLNFVNRKQNNEERQWQQPTNEGRGYVIDLFFRRHLGPLFFMTEGYLWLGEVDILLDHPIFTDKKILYDEVNFRQYNFAIRTGWSSHTSDLSLEYGYASPVSENEFPPSLQELLSAEQITIQGNANEGNFIIAPPVYPQRYLNGGHFNRNYNVDLILFEELLNLYTYYTPTPTDDTQSGVYNSQYVRFLSQRKFFDKRLSLKGSIIFAWLNDNNGLFWGAQDLNSDGQIQMPRYEDVITTDCETDTTSDDCITVIGPDGSPTQVKKVQFEIAKDGSGNLDLGEFKPVGNVLGLEVDTDIAYHMWEWFTIGLEAGLAFPGGFFDDLVAITDPFNEEAVIFSNRIVFTLQGRLVISF